MYHSILLHRLEKLVGIQGVALQWLDSYLKDRTFSVSIWTFSSLPAPLSCDVPQGSILGPLLFSLYMLPLGAIFKKYKIHSPARGLGTGDPESEGSALGDSKCISPSPRGGSGG